MRNDGESSGHKGCRNDSSGNDQADLLQFIVSKSYTVR
jgi:hypothetical protein